MNDLLAPPNIKQLELRLATLEREKADYQQRFEELVQVQDLAVRVRRNSKVSLAYKFMYMALVETYPALLDDIPMNISVCLVRENAGWISEASATNFFQDMQTIGAFTYTPGDYNKKENERIGYLIPQPEIFPYPESFDTKSVEKRKKARETEKKKRQEWQAAWRIYQCEACESTDIIYDVVPICNSCKHRHAPVQNIDGNRITITPVDAMAEPDDWDALAEAHEAANIINFPTELTEDDFNAFGRKRG